MDADLWGDQEVEEEREDLFANDATQTSTQNEIQLPNTRANSIEEDDFSDNELPEEELATGGNPIEDDLEAIMREGHISVDVNDTDKGAEIHLPDLFGGLPAAPAKQTANWIANIQEVHVIGGNSEKDTWMVSDPMAHDQILRQYYPSFQEGYILNFSELFSAKAPSFVIPKIRLPKVCVPSRIQLEIETDDVASFMTPLRRSRANEQPYRKPGVVATRCMEIAEISGREDWTLEEGEDDVIDLDMADANLLMACADWDEKIIWEDTEDRRTIKHSSAAPKLRFSGDEADARLWTSSAIFDGIVETSKIVLNMNDSHLLLSEQHYRAHRAQQRAALKRTMSQRFNISNDEAYDMLRENNQSRVRSTLSQLTIEHAAFADRLQSPYYKTKLSKSEARSFHRPTMVVKPNYEVKFAKLKLRKKKKDRSRDPHFLLKSTKDISLSDNTGFVMLEYTEEYPAVLSNIGMGSKIINYYRKRFEEDENRPRADFGEANILGPQDRSPFWNFGTVEPGETVPTLYNKMTRAPIFKHETNKTDFLLIRTSTKHGTRYFLRSTKHIYTVGQIFPVIDVPGPHSRKVTTSSKNRLKMISYRLIRREGNGRLSVKDLAKHFPDQNDMQIRQRLKDFMEFQRKGDDQGWWKLRQGETVPTEEATRAMISPETVCLLDSMQVGLRHLEDAGYGKTADDDDADEEDMTTEQQLAPWIATRNFINATQGKAMLRLYGEGDPTGRGEGYSYIRTSMKGGFKPMGESVDEKLESDIPKNAHSYNVAKQQKAYEDEIARIWNAQRMGLSLSKDQMLNDQDLEDMNRDDVPGPVYAESASPGPSLPDLEREEDLMSMNSAMSANSAHKVLRITRVNRNAIGQLGTHIEVVQDPHIIHAYVKKRRALDEQALSADAMAPSNDEDKNKRMKKLLQEELARLKRNKERRVARKIAKANGTLGSRANATRLGHVADQPHATGNIPPILRL